MITLTPHAEQCLKVLHALDRGKLLVAEAAQLLGRSVRQVRRLLRAFRTRGTAALVHRLVAPSPGHAVAEPPTDHPPLPKPTVGKAPPAGVGLRRSGRVSSWSVRRPGTVQDQPSACRHPPTPARRRRFALQFPRTSASGIAAGDPA